MTFNEYQYQAQKTAIYPTKNNTGLYYVALGLAGEAGEISNKVKKTIRDNGGIINEVVRQSIADEIGDLCWYMAALAKEIGVPLDTIAKNNIEKLQDRLNRNVISGNGDNR